MKWHEVVFEFNFWKYGFYISLFYFYRFRFAFANCHITHRRDTALSVIAVYIAACLWPLWVVWEGGRLGWRVGEMIIAARRVKEGK